MIISENGPRSRLTSIYRGSWLGVVSQSPEFASCARRTDCGGAGTASEDPCYAVDAVGVSIYCSLFIGFNVGMEPSWKILVSIMLVLACILVMVDIHALQNLCRYLRLPEEMTSVMAKGTGSR